MVKQITNKKIILVGIVAFIAMLIGWSVIYIMRGVRATDGISMDSGWTLCLNDKRVENVDISTYTVSNLKRLDSIEISRLVTEDLQRGYTAQVRSQYCSVEVFVNDDMIFSYGTSEVMKNRFLGSGYCFVELPDDIQGKVLKIRFIINERNAITDIGRITLEPTSDAMRVFANKNATSVYLNAFVLVFGLVLVAIGLSVRANGRDYLSLILIGVFSAMIGHWSNCQGKIYQIFSDSLIKLSTQEFLCLYTAPIPLAVFIWRKVKEEGGWREMVLRVTTIVFTAFDVLAVFLHFTNIVRFPQILLTYHVLGAIGIIAISVAGIFKIRKEKTSDKIVILAFAEIALAAFMDLIRLNVQRVFLPSKDNIVEVSLLPMGAILLVTMLTASYLFSLYEKVLSHAERDALTKLAYHDPLTGIYNRAKANERFKELEAKDSVYALVNFDVNGLKYVNDNFGHDEGDVLLKKVAELIEKNFNEIGTGYRMSGDEFLCVIDPAGIFTVKQAADRFKKDLKEASKNSKYVLSVSYGIAYKNINDDKSVQEVYSEADEKMYAMKARSKHSRQALEEEGKNKQRDQG
ncbi:MAG: GGDEF domain-containing protein [Lachnospiraceae bacterium]|nr:GGDEF domain-containing protein [Lachnospiraceae bacterium]